MKTMAGKVQGNLAQEMDRGTAAKGQYTLWQILGIWLATGAPMWILGWLIYPALSKSLNPVDAGLLRIKLLTLGLIWEFVYAMIILFREEGDIRLATISRRFRLNHPVSPKTGVTSKRLWWWIIPLIALGALIDVGIGPLLDGIWTKLLPFFVEPEGYSMAALFAPELQARWVGAWGLLALFLLSSVFNSFLGEEFMFRGVLLPGMNGVFGGLDWVANGILFGLYHLHQPWSIPLNILAGLLIAFSAKRFGSNWFPIIIHSGQAVYFSVLILGLVLGLA